MNKIQYIKELKKDILSLLVEYKLNNYKNQAFAWRLNASFKRTFEESYLWNRALFLSTNSCILLLNDKDKKIALNGLFKSAEIFEYLSDLPNIENNYDKDYLLILSALCYDLSGYQANAYCIASKINDYKLMSENKRINLEIDNHIINQLRLILLKNIPYAYNLNTDLSLKNDNGFQILIKALNCWYEGIIKLESVNCIEQMNTAYKYYLFSGNTYLSHLIFLLKTRIFLYSERSIWNILSYDENIKGNKNWRKYIKLLANDYYSNDKIKDISERRSIFEFWTSQLRAIEKGLVSSDENFVVQMPTSAGKTFIAELAILKYLIKYPDKKCIYIAPFRALTNEKEWELSKYFSKLGFSVSSLSGSYEIDGFQDLILSETDLLIATPEKVDLLLRLKPDFFKNVSFIVVDEGHIIGDISTRATLLEFLIIRLRIKIPELKTLFISAVMPPNSANEYSLWLSGKEDNVLRSLKFPDSNINDEWEPTRKLISRFEWIGKIGDIIFQNVTTEDENTKQKQGARLYGFLKDKEFGGKHPKAKDKMQTAAALAYKLSEEGSTLVFCGQVKRIESVGKRFLELLEVIDKIPDRFKLNKGKKSSFYSRIWFEENFYITKLIDHGIGIHYGDMPEQLRTAVEDDFRKGNLSVLLSTSTVGQGLNFPIKNLIFYDLSIGYDEKNKEVLYIQNRDFWNIVGRAGRAGKETEGKIVYIINSNNDINLYNKYIEKENIEEAVSLICKILDLLIDNRLDTSKFDTLLSLLSETYLLDLLTEEIIETKYEEIINQIINNSLFKVQVDKRNLNLNPLIDGFKKIFRTFAENATLEQLKIYHKTGFSFKSNRIIDNFIKENLEKLKQAVENDDYLLIINSFLNLLAENTIDEMLDDKLSNLKISPNDCFDIIEKWIDGTSIQNLTMEWTQKTGKDVDKFHIFISKALYYLYPWGMTSFLLILTYKLSIEFNDLPENIKNLPSYLKYGLYNSTSCMACSLGIKNREVALFLYQTSNELTGKNFIRWLSNLTNEEIDSFNISDFDKENLRQVSLRLTPNSYRKVQEEFQFFIKGTYFNTDWKENSKIIKLGDSLNYEREYQNPYDPYAILISKDNKLIGYVPREYSKLISSEIDIEEVSYDIKVIEVIEKKEYNEIKVNIRNENIHYFL